MSIHISELPDADRLVCRCNGEPYAHKLKTRARCGDCNGWLYPTAYELPDHARNLAMLHLVGVLRAYDTPKWVAGRRHYRDNPISLTKFKRVLRPERIRLGIEVELSAREEDEVAASYHFTRALSMLERAYEAAVRKEATSYCILKNDGSIRGHGGEFSCVPATIKEHFRVWSSFPFHRFKSEEESCGLHVHIDRRDISPLTIGKFHCFWNRIAELDCAVRLMGRKPTTYCQVRTATPSRLPKQIPATKKRRRRPARIGTSEKFSVVNHLHRATVELRLPLHPRSVNQLEQRLLAVEASASFLKLYSIADCVGASPVKLWDDFMAWCLSQHATPDFKTFASRCT